MLRKPRYVIAVHDLQRSADYYRNVLGFDVHTIDDGGWLFFVKDECFIMAGECPDALSPHDLGDHSYFAYLESDDIETFYNAVVSRGAVVIKPIRTEAWGMREFGVRTADGHRIMFGCPTAAAG